MSIDGDTAIITLHQAKGAEAAGRPNAATLARAGYGAAVDSYWHGFDDAEVARRNPVPESVCGTDARRDVVCYQSSHPTEYGRSRAVARLLSNGRGMCTTWRVGNTNRMVTNNHCTSSAASVRANEAQFDYECATCGGNNPRPGVKVSGAE